MLSNFRGFFAKVPMLPNVYQGPSPSHYDQIIDKHYLQGLNNLRKNIFNVLEVNLDENLSLKKKSPNLPPNTKVSDIFEIKISLVARNGR
jgi:hypothetical protein